MIDFFLELGGLEKFVAILTVVYALCAVIGIILRFTGRAKIKKYRGVNAAAGKATVEVARKMLNEKGLNHVLIHRCEDKETPSHYDPVEGYLKLEEKVFASPSVGAIAIACHEAGHAMKHDEEADFGQMRVKLISILTLTNRLIFPCFALGLILYALVPVFIVSQIGLVFIFLSALGFTGGLFYALISLPFELDASKRANKYLGAQKIFSNADKAGMRKVLKTLKYTYVVEFLYSPVAGVGYVIWRWFVPKD